MSGTGTFTAPMPVANQDHLDQSEKESFISQVPNWIEVEELPWSERIEI